MTAGGTFHVARGGAPVLQQRHAVWRLWRFRSVFACTLLGLQLDTPYADRISCLFLRDNQASLSVTGSLRIFARA